MDKDKQREEEMPPVSEIIIPDTVCAEAENIAESLANELLWFQKPFLSFDDVQPCIGAGALVDAEMQLSAYPAAAQAAQYSAFYNVSVVTENGKQGLYSQEGTILITPQFDNIKYIALNDTMVADGSSIINADFSVESAKEEEESSKGFFVWNEATKAVYFLGGEETIYLYGPLYPEKMLPVKEIYFETNAMEKAADSDIGLDAEKLGIDYSQARGQVFYNPDSYDAPNEKRMLAYREAVENTGDWGYAVGKKLITPCVYDAAVPVPGDIGRVRRGDMWFYISSDGRQVIEKGFPDEEGISRYDFSEGIAAVSDGDKWGYVNSEGQTVIPYQFEEARPVRMGFAWVKENGLWGILNLREYSQFPQLTEEIQENGTEAQEDYGQSEETDYEALYMEYLNGDGWKTGFIEDDSWKFAEFRPEDIDFFDGYELAEYKLLDFDLDGVTEMWFAMQNPNSYGVKGYETAEGFCTVTDSEVTAVIHGFKSYGSIGGTGIDFAYDTWNDSHVIRRYGSFGGFGGRSESLEFFRFVSGTLEKQMEASMQIQNGMSFSGEYSDVDISGEYIVDEMQMTESEYSSKLGRFKSPVRSRFVIKGNEEEY